MNIELNINALGVTKRQGSTYIGPWRVVFLSLVGRNSNVYLLLPVIRMGERVHSMHRLIRDQALSYN